MQTAHKLLLLLSGGGLSYASYIASLAPVLWLRLRETSGTNAANSGSLGAAADGTWTPGAGAVGQTGQLGANEAYDFDGAASDILIPDATAINNVAVVTYATLFKADGAGENNIGMFYSSSTRQFRINSSSFPVRMFISGTANANSVTNNSFISTGAYHWIFATFDNTGDRKVRLYKGISGAVTEATYTTQDAMTGPIVNTATHHVGNNAAANGTFDGLIDESLIFDRVLTTAEMLQITTLSGLT